MAAHRGNPGDPPQAASYQGCVNTYTGVLCIISEGEQCRPHEMPIQLSGSASNIALQERIQTLEGAVESLQQEALGLQSKIDALEQENAALRA